MVSSANLVSQRQGQGRSEQASSPNVGSSNGTLKKIGFVVAVALLSAGAGFGVHFLGGFDVNPSIVIGSGVFAIGVLVGGHLHYRSQMMDLQEKFGNNDSCSALETETPTDDDENSSIEDVVPVSGPASTLDRPRSLQAISLHRQHVRYTLHLVAQRVWSLVLQRALDQIAYVRYFLMCHDVLKGLWNQRNRSDVLPLSETQLLERPLLALAKVNPSAAIVRLEDLSRVNLESAESRLLQQAMLCLIFNSAISRIPRDIWTPFSIKPTERSLLLTQPVQERVPDPQPAKEQESSSSGNGSPSSGSNLVKKRRRNTGVRSSIANGLAFGTSPGRLEWTAAEKAEATLLHSLLFAKAERSGAGHVFSSTVIDRLKIDENYTFIRDLLRTTGESPAANSLHRTHFNGTWDHSNTAIPATVMLRLRKHYAEKEDRQKPKQS